MRSKGRFVKKNQVQRLKKLEETRRIRFSREDHAYFTSTNNALSMLNVVEREEVVENTESWREGRRIVELAVLADGLKACELCSQPLHLFNCVGERNFGLAQFLDIKCGYTECGHVNAIATGSRHLTDKGGYAWDVNTKLAAGMINGGFGETHISNLLAALNIPPISYNSLKAREREVGQKLLEMATESCKKHLTEEAELSNEEISASFDGAWQRRGTGRAYNSLSGHVSLIGEKTGKCIGFGVKSSHCKVCSTAYSSNQMPKEHICSKNWTGTSKGMEPALACDMLQDVINQGHRVSTLITDNDATTISRVKAIVDPTITKKTDSNHIRKSFTSALINLSNEHRQLKNQKVRTHIERCFMFSLHQNQENPEQLGNALEAIVPHLYGEHQSCGNWCRSAEKGYKPKNLPFGKPLSDLNLRMSLGDLISKYVLKSDILCKLGSSQANENFNHMVSSKAPKRMCYSGSESLVSRVSATVCQKNEGHNYLLKLNKNCCLSPGTFTRKHTIKLANKLKRKRLLQKSSKYKRRRLELRASRSSKNAVKTVLEGDTYSTNIELKDHADIEEISVLPEKHLTAQQPFMFFDLETTGLGRNSDIIQIAAVCNEETFNTYVFPTKPISPGASSATGLSVKDGQLLLHGRNVETVKQKDGLSQFLTFVKKFPYPCIIGHNIKNFDVPVLINSLEKYGLCETLNQSISGFVDTLVVARTLYKKNEVNGSFSQQSLITCLLGKEYAAHNALEDVVALRELFEHFNLNENQLNDFVFQLSYFACKSSLHTLVEKKIISQNVCNKLAACSLGMSQLRKIHSRDDVNGIVSILKECKIGKKCAIASKIMKFFDDLSSEA